MKNKDTRKIWFVEHPLHQYKEDAKTLARQNNIKIIDARYKSSIADKYHAEKVPELTLKTAEAKEPVEVKEDKKKAK